MHKNIIITASDKTYGDFLIDGWFRSLKKNVNLSNTDVLVIDFGLSTQQVTALLKKGVMIEKGAIKNHIVIQRFLDTGRILHLPQYSRYSQVLFIDGGDIIFQKDISSVFEQTPHMFRAVTLKLEMFFYDIHIKGKFKEKQGKIIWEFLKDKSVINAGVIFAPKDLFIHLCDEIGRLVSSKEQWGSDQVVVNYVLYKKGVTLLPATYNYIINTTKEQCVLKRGLFFTNDGEKAAIVHNAGRFNFMRSIENFGYGRDKNKLRGFLYHTKRIFFIVLDAIKAVDGEVEKHR